jgi:hypothetical protein
MEAFMSIGLLNPLPLTEAQITGSNIAPIRNLLDPDVQVVATTLALQASLLIDLGADTLIDTLALPLTTASAQTQITLRAGTSAQGASCPQTLRARGALSLEGDPGPRRTFFWHAPTPVLVRYLTLVLEHTSAGLAIPALVLGKAFKPAVPQNWGDGVGVGDSGLREQLPLGGVLRRTGQRIRAYSWAWSRLSDMETAELGALLMDRGESAPVLVFSRPDEPTGLWMRVLWGDFVDLKTWSRTMANETTYEATVLEAR